MDVDDFFDKQNQTEEDESLDDLIADVVESMFDWEQLETGEKIIESYGKQVYFELYEKYIKGRGYLFDRPEEFWCKINKIKYAYAHEGNLHVCYKPNYRYTMPNIANVEMVAFLVNRQIGVLENVGNSSAE